MHDSRVSRVARTHKGTVKGCGILKYFLKLLFFTTLICSPRLSSPLFHLFPYLKKSLGCSINYARFILCCFSYFPVCCCCSTVHTVLLVPCSKTKGKKNRTHKKPRKSKITKKISI